MSLQLTQLAGFSAGADFPPVAIAKTADGAVPFSASTTGTLSGASLGAAAPDRRIYVAYTHELNTVSATGITIAGIAATRHIGKSFTTPTPDLEVSIWSALVPSGTTGNIVVTLSASATVTGWATVYRVTGAAVPLLSARSSEGSSTNGGSASLVAVPGGAVIGAMACINDAVTCSATGATIDTDLDAGAHRHCSAFQATTIANAAHTLQLLGSAVSAYAMVGLSIAPAPYKPPASFIFNGANTDLRATIVSASPNRRTFSHSLWMKWASAPTEDGVGHTIIDMGPDASAFLDFGVRDASNAQGEYTFINGAAAGVAAIDVNSADANLVAGVWFHLLIATDTTQATGTNRVKTYVNGGANSAIFFTTPAQNADLRFMVNGDSLYIGQDGLGAGWFNGRLAFVQLIEGVQVVPTDVGEFDGGVWKHKRYASAYGSHGLYLPGSRGFSDIVRNLSLAGSNMTPGSNLDLNDLPPFVSF